MLETASNTRIQAMQSNAIGIDLKIPKLLFQTSGQFVSIK